MSDDKNNSNEVKDTSTKASFVDPTTAKSVQASALVSQNAIIPGSIKPRHLVPGLTHDGDMYYSKGSNFGRISAGTTGDLFTIIDGVPQWSTLLSSTVTELNLLLSDNTIADVSIIKHGFAPKAPNDTTKFLRGDATWAVPVVVESQFNFTDITTADVSTTKHGLTPKLPNDSTKYLSGAGTYTVPTIVESQFSFTDVTTADSSSTKHGLLPKLSNTATTYLDGTGAFSTPTGSTPKVRQVSQAVNDDVQSTTSSNVDLADMSITMTVLANSKMMAMFTSNCSHSSADSLVLFNIDVDGGGGVQIIVTSPVSSTNGDRQGAALNYESAALSAGSHTIKIKWGEHSGAGTAYCSTRTLIVMEVTA